MRPAALVLAALLAAGPLAANTDAQAPADPAAAVTTRDTAFWQAYNACDTASMRTFFSEDVEFYHDVGGPTLGLPALGKTLDTNLCGGASRIRREPVADTVRVSLLREGGNVYGAVMTGEHLFHLREPGQADRLDGRARFAHLWLLKDGAWKMTRILSYDHGPATK